MGAGYLAERRFTKRLYSSIRPAFRAIGYADTPSCRPLSRCDTRAALHKYYYCSSLFHKPLNLARVFIGLFVIIDGNEQ